MKEKQLNMYFPFGFTNKEITRVVILYCDEAIFTFRIALILHSNPII